MAVTWTAPGDPLKVTLATTCTRIDLPTASHPNGWNDAGGLLLRIVPTVECYVVQDGATVDGAALPANYSTVPTAGDYYPVSGRQLLLAGVSAGSATIYFAKITEGS